MLSIDIKESDTSAEVLVSYKVEISSELEIPLRGITANGLEDEIAIMINEVLLLVAKDIKNEKDKYE